MRDIKDYNLSELEAFFEEWGAPTFRAKQVFSWIYRKKILEFQAMQNLPLPIRLDLKEKFFIAKFEITDVLKSRDGTEKFLFKLADGNFLESVIIPVKERITGCISSQIGCKFGCNFCASGIKGFKRNLTCGEIIEEVLRLNCHLDQKQLTHLVFMGTGEPFDNYDNVVKAIKIINSDYSFNIGARRITISTSGIIPGIKKLAKENLQIELSISLHAADDQLRSSLMPVNKLYPLEELMAVCRQYYKVTNRQVTFEYVLMQGVNSDLLNAQKLAKLLQGLDAKVNLILANPVKELGIIAPPKEETLKFKEYLMASGLPVTLRKSRGQDIEAACGQLRLRYDKD